jgi:hypothetical protein
VSGGTDFDYLDSLLLSGRNGIERYLSKGLSVSFGDIDEVLRYPLDRYGVRHGLKTGPWAASRAADDRSRQRPRG